MEKEQHSLSSATTQRTLSKLNTEEISIQNANIPKTGARIRDDFKPKTPSTEVSEVEKETATAVYLPGLVEGGKQVFCLEELSRGLVWQTSLPGSLLSTSCPDEASGLAMRECQLDGQGWSRPQLGQCTAGWLVTLASSYTSHAVSPGQLSMRLRQEIENRELFGGDIIGVLDLAERLIKNAQFENEGSDQKQQSLNLAHSLSSLLDRRSIPAWLDLSLIELEFQRSRFINLLTELGIVALNNQRPEHHLNADNLDLSVIHLVRRGENLVSKFGDLSLDGGFELLSSQKPRSPVPHLLLLKVFKVDTLLSISGGQNGGEEDVTILSPVVSLFAKNFNNRFLPLGLNLTIKHLVVTDKKKECVRWDVHVNFWTGEGCKTLFSNSTHTVCSFDYISTYALIQASDVPEDLKILPIVIISITICCVAAIILTFAFLCWKRVKTHTKPVVGCRRHWWCCQSKTWDDFYTLPDPTSLHSAQDFYSLPDPTSLHSARATSTQSSMISTTTQMSRPHLDDGRCCYEEKDMGDSLESPLHLGEYHVVTLQRRDQQMGVTLQKMGQHHGTTHQRFQTVQALPSESQYSLRHQGIKYNTSNRDFNMSSGYYLKPSQRRHQSVEEWCQGSESWSPTQSSRGNIYAEVGSQDYYFEGDSGYTEGGSKVRSQDYYIEGDSGYTEEGSSDVASDRKEESLYTSSSSNSILAIYNQKPRPATNAAIVDRDARKTMNPKVFSISKVVGRENYCNEHSQQVVDHQQLKFGRRGGGQEGKE